MAERGIATVADLSRRTGVSRDTYQAWWRGRVPSRGTAELTARELGVSYLEIIQAREGRDVATMPGIVTDPGIAALTDAIRVVIQFG